MQLEKSQTGFTIIEIVIGLAVFAVLVVGALGAISAVTNTVKVAREKTILNSLVAADLEIVRNLPYSEVGTVNGNPSGVLPDEPNPRSVTLEGQAYQVYYEITNIDDPADGVFPTDTVAADYKQAKMFVRHQGTGKVTTIITNIIPEGLEALADAGALVVDVIDAQGQPVAGANVYIENTLLDPDIILNRTTDSTGRWTEVGLPASVNGYHLVATKTGFSTDQTYPITVQNPNPIKPDATIVNGQITQVTLAIDLLSNLTIATVDKFCQPVNGVGINIRGEKLIGLNPTVYKFNADYTSSGGQVLLPNIEWDTYTPVLQTGQPYTIRGTSPVQQVTVLPGTNQTFTFVLDAPSTNSFRVIVKDAATGAPLEGALVHLRKGGSTPQDYNATTGGSVWVQTSWTGNSGQVDFLPQPPNEDDRYAADDGNIDINSDPTGVRLLKISSDYQPSGWLESSTFDTGTGDSNFTTIAWEPTSQNPSTALRFQIATSNDPAGPWAYTGPDGTASTYYTVSGSTISSVHDDSRYIRYKAYLSTTNNKRTPVLTSLLLNYVSGCFTPGQVLFENLTSGNNYDLDITLTGYQVFTETNLTIDGNTVYEVLMSP